MTNGEKIREVFPNARIKNYKATDLVDEHVTVFINGCDTCQDYSMEWWNSEYKEPTTKNDLGVEKTDMIDKSNFSQEQYKTDLQSAYDCGKSVLGKIRAEIEHLGADDDKAFCKSLNASYKQGLKDALNVLDKYKAESEEVE